MNATTVAVDLAKNVFELAVADGHWKIVERARLSRAQLERWFSNRAVDLVVMEACGSAHHWARHLQRLGIAVRLLPPRYVRAYVKRNKTDAADAAALLEAARRADIVPVRIKSIEQQALQSLHRARSGWMATPDHEPVDRRDPTAGSAHRAAGDPAHCRGSPLSGVRDLVVDTRHLGRISKRGDRYLRMLLTHGARSVLRAATVAQRCGRPLDPLRQWAIALQARSNHNKATCALANKLARICYATLRDQEPFEKARLLKKAARQAFPIPA